jgi:DNA-binding response OmpR family regulator
MSQPGENISRRQIIEALGFDYLDYDQRRLDTQMRRLRRRVEDVSGQTLPVKTLRNSGYCFYQPAQVLA